MSDTVLPPVSGKPGAAVLERMLAAQQAVSSCLVEMPPTERLFQQVLQILCETLGWSLGVAWQPADDGEALECVAVWNGDASAGVGRFGAASMEQRFARGRGLPGQAWLSGETLWIDDLRLDPRMQSANGAVRAGLQGAVAVPLRAGEQAVGIVELFSGADRRPDPATLTWLTTVGHQLAQYLMRWDAQRRLVEHDRALSAARNGIVIADATQQGFPIVFVNDGFERLTGYTLAEVAGRSCSLLQGEGSDPAVVEELAEALGAGRAVHATVRNYRKDGSPFWNELHLSPVHDDEGQLVQYIGVQNDVTDQRDAEEQANYYAYHDQLTGLANRALLHRVLDRAAGRSAHQGTAVALLYLDLDDFKRLNDRFGHAACDELLRGLSRSLRETARDNDLVARQGGDEFLVVMADLAPESARATALAAAERVRAAIGAPTVVGDETVNLRASVGVSVLGEDAPDVDALLRHADAAMYRAKRTGRGVNGYQATGAAPGPETPAAPAPAADAHELDRLIAEGAIRAVYQPIVDLATRDVVAFEALARGPEGSPLQRPDRLFETARATGRLGELDWVCSAAAMTGALAAPDRSRKLFVNVEPQALGTACPEALEAVFARAEEELDVVLEITERALTARPAELLQLVESVRARGWGIALDDVGADIRSLALMPLLRPDVIKLDLRLVQDQPTTEVAEIVHAVNAERERTGAVILAEGIETEAHLRTAQALGATVGQGWLFGRPGELPAEPEPVGVTLPPARSHVVVEGTTPYEAVKVHRQVSRADKRLLLSISMNLEQQAAALGECGIILSAFQTAPRFTPLTHRRYTLLASDAAFVGALGVDLATEPAPGVRGASIGPEDPLAGEWSVVVLGPHFAAALVAVDLGDTGPEMQRRFDFALTYDRDLVVDAAATLMRRIAPLGA